jgi:hypothetical protein
MVVNIIVICDEEHSIIEIPCRMTMVEYMSENCFPILRQNNCNTSTIKITKTSSTETSSRCVVAMEEIVHRT